MGKPPRARGGVNVSFSLDQVLLAGILTVLVWALVAGWG
jgi:hypothetical protein